MDKVLGCQGVIAPRHRIYLAVAFIQEQEKQGRWTKL